MVQEIVVIHNINFDLNKIICKSFRKHKICDTLPIHHDKFVLQLHHQSIMNNCNCAKDLCTLLPIIGIKTFAFTLKRSPFFFFSQRDLNNFGVRVLV